MFLVPFCKRLITGSLTVRWRVLLRDDFRLHAAFVYSLIELYKYLFL